MCSDRGDLYSDRPESTGSVRVDGVKVARIKVELARAIRRESRTGHKDGTARRDLT